MKKCPICGRDSAGKFCPWCGTPLPETSTSGQGQGGFAISPNVSLEAGGDAIFVRPQIDASVHIGSQTNIAGNLILQIPDTKPSTTPIELMERARYLLHHGMYNDCESTLRQILALDPRYIEAHAYLVPCLLKGRNASQVSQKIVSEVETHLQAIVDAPAWRGFALAAWAILKHDRFVINGMSEGHPQLEDLVAEYKNMSLSPEESSLLRHVNCTSAVRRLLGLPEKSA